MARRLYTPDLARRSLPLVSAIARDVRDTAQRIRAIWLEIRDDGDGSSHEGLDDRLRDLRRRFSGLVAEFESLGVELKDPMSGLLDFRAQRGEQEVYLCWRLGEDSVDYWHSLDGRQNH